MNQMDIDEDVPDTPDRLANQGIGGVRMENRHSSLRQMFLEDGSRDQPMIIDSGTKGPSVCSPKRSSSPCNSRQQSFSLASSSSSRKSHLFQKGTSDKNKNKNPSYLSHDSVNKHHLKSGRPSFMSKSSSSHDDDFLDMTGMNFHRPVTRNASPSKVTENNQVEFRKRSGLANGTSSLHGPTNFPSASCMSKSSSSHDDDDFLDMTGRNFHRPVTRNASPSKATENNQVEFRKRSGLANGTSSHGPANFPTASCHASEERNNVSRVGSSIGLGEGMEFVGHNNNKPGNGDFLSLDPIVSPRMNKQKRLVRNGCISPNNIAKAKQFAGKDINGSLAVACNNGSTASSALPISIDIMDLVAEDNDSHIGKGKGVMSHPCSSMAPDSQNRNLHIRSSISFDEKAMGTSDNKKGAGKSIEESGGWRSTRNRTREMNIPSPDKECYLIRESDAPSQRHASRLERREKGTNVASRDAYSKLPTSEPSQYFRIPPIRESVSRPRTRLGRLNGPRSAADTLIKRQKQGSTSSSFGECSTSVSDDADVFLSSSAEAANSRSTSSNVDNLTQIIEVDESSPQSCRNAHDEDARARQLEADELLARELQEQLYSEVPAFGVQEVDEHIALALQHQDDSNHGSSRARRPVADARLVSNLHRQSQPRSSSNASRRGSLGRGSTLGRMATLRSRFPGQPRSLLPSRGRTSIFPADMDVDMRMHILGALEEFGDMGLGTGILQAHRDFNENDYEMLLALDENNHQHGGASVHLINGLPLSTVQGDNFDEACAVCLDTPTIGDTIRHLPCLHKFHKDCIDPWLRRKTSCPVCKSSIS